MNFIEDYEYVTIKATGERAEVAYYIGSDIWRLRYEDVSKKEMPSFRGDEIDWGSVDKEAMRKRCK